MSGKKLTRAEREVETHLLLGLSNAEIAQIIGCSDKTIKFHMTSIFKSKGVTTRSEYIANYYLAVIKKYQKLTCLPISIHQEMIEDT